MLFAATADLDPGVVTRLARELPQDEQRRAAAFAFDRDRRTYVAAHALLRRGLRPLLRGAEPLVVPGALGRPELDAAQRGQPPLTFNLTHTQDFAACAILRGAPVGIDAEDIRRPIEVAAVAQRWFAAAECALLDALPISEQAELFFRIWTLKEAILKAAGCGLRVSPERFAVEPGQDAASLPSDLGIPIEWRLAELTPSPYIRLAVAVPGREQITLTSTAVDLA